MPRARAGYGESMMDDGRHRRLPFIGLIIASTAGACWPYESIMKRSWPFHYSRHNKYLAAISICINYFTHLFADDID